MDAVNLGRQLSLPIEGDRIAGIRQTSGELHRTGENCQTSADSVCSPFPSLARRGAEQDLPGRDAPLVGELPTEDQLKVWLHEERARLELTGVGAQERK